MEGTFASEDEYLIFEFHVYGNATVVERGCVFTGYYTYYMFEEIYVVKVHVGSVDYRLEFQFADEDLIIVTCNISETDGTQLIKQ